MEVCAALNVNSLRFLRNASSLCFRIIYLCTQFAKGLIKTADPSVGLLEALALFNPSKHSHL